MPARAEWRLPFLRFMFLRNRREADQFRFGQPDEIADHVVFVQPLHHKNDETLRLVVEAGEQRMAEPMIGFGALDLGQSLFRLGWIIDNNHVGSEPGEHAADGRRNPRAACSRLK